jgi:low affinity Fe/Cu permease
MNGIRERFRAFATKISLGFGSPWAFACALLLVIVWAATGPYFHYSDAWQLVINTGTTIGTFLLVFVLQNTQIRDTKALNIKLDELLRALDGARTGLVNVEELPDEELDRIFHELERLGRIAGVPKLADDDKRDGVPTSRTSASESR